MTICGGVLLIFSGKRVGCVLQQKKMIVMRHGCSHVDVEGPPSGYIRHVYKDG